ncbi:MAG: hypothetical protein OXH31_07755 [Gammaproteobacteria bacterium]|nr:hypothetical protein [Gammaproteobacteria bacterium]
MSSQFGRIDCGGHLYYRGLAATVQPPALILQTVSNSDTVAQKF